MEKKQKPVKPPKARKPISVKLHGDKIIWLVVFLLALISIVAVYSSSSAQAFRESKPIYHYLFEQIIFVSMGFTALLFCYLIPLGWYRKLSIALFIFSILLMIYTIKFGVEINGARRWIKLGPITFQPSELAKIATILYLARILEVANLSSFKEYLLKILLPIGVVCVLSLWGSVSVILIIGFISLIILICYGIKWKYLGITVAVGIVGIGLVIGVHAIWPESFKRIDTFTSRVERFFQDDKESNLSAIELQNLKDKKYQEEQAVQAIQLGKGMGRGVGNSLKRNDLPHAESDFIYAYIIEETGILGGIFVLMLYLWFFNRCIFIAQSCKKIYSTITVLGLSLLITIQALLHILVNVGIFPVTGQPLPLISSGGTSFIFMSCAFGIILSVNRTIEISVSKEQLTPTKNEQ